MNTALLGDKITHDIAAVAEESDSNLLRRIKVHDTAGHKCVRFRKRMTCYTLNLPHQCFVVREYLNDFNWQMPTVPKKRNGKVTAAINRHDLRDNKNNM